MGEIFYFMGNYTVTTHMENILSFSLISFFACHNTDINVSSEICCRIGGMGKLCPK